MPLGPKPLGKRATTPAEWQARYRAAYAADTAATVKVRYRRPADRRGRPQQWRDAVAEQVELQAGYQQWLDALPESLTERLRPTRCGPCATSTCSAWGSNAARLRTPLKVVCHPLRKMCRSRYTALLARLRPMSRQAGA